MIIMQNDIFLSMREDCKKNILVALGYIFILLSSYLPVYTEIYAFSDDWVRINSILNNDLQWGEWETQSGRPVYGILLSLSNFFISSLNSLNLFRFIAVFVLLIYCIMFYLFLVKNKFFLYSTTLQILIPLTISVSPPVYLYCAWFVCYPFLFSMCFSLAAFMVICPDNRLRIKNIIVSIFLLSISFAIYQPCAMVFLFYLSIYILHCNNVIQKRQKIFFYIGIWLSGVIIALLMAKIIPLLFGLEPVSRGKLDFNLFANIKWFFEAALPFSVKAFMLVDFSSYIVSFLFIFFALLLYIISRNVFTFGMLLFIFIISYAPQMMLSEKWLAIRTSITLILFYILVILVGVNKIFKNLLYKNIVTVGISLLIILHTNFVFNKYFISSSQDDFNQLNSHVVQLLNKDPHCIDLDLTDKHYSIGDFSISDEIGIRSSAIEWAAPGMMNMITSRFGYSKRDGNNCKKIFQKDIK